MLTERNDEPLCSANFAPHRLWHCSFLSRSLRRRSACPSGGTPCISATRWRLFFRVVKRGYAAAASVDPQERIIIGVRLPRVLLGLLVGGGLSVAGAGMQALLSNPAGIPRIRWA